MMVIFHPCVIAWESEAQRKSDKEFIKIMFTQNDLVGEKAMVVGRIEIYSSTNEYVKDNLQGKASDKSKATARLNISENVFPGDILYVINDRNLVVAKFRVRNVFKSISFGYMAIGTGNFRLGSIGDRLVMKVDNDGSGEAYINTARGNYYHSMGDDGAAISEYKKALSLDKKNPQAHLHLGYLYKRQGLGKFAYKEFSIAYENIVRLYDNNDKYLLLKGMAEICFVDIYDGDLSEAKRDNRRIECVRYCNEALKLNPDSIKMNYLLGILYYKNSKPSDEKAKDFFLRVIQLNPGHASALVYLSELYYKHENLPKAEFYAKQAIEYDPENKRAREMLKYIDRSMKEPQNK
jgi:tetratricopeptide (TPR) repeat protein